MDAAVLPVSSQGLPLQAQPQPHPRRTALVRWLGRGLETHIALPLFALLLVAALWTATSSSAN
ncbi:MAG: hypothetical protein EOP92_32885, partial [Lysobacteraceae bacterium]